MKKNLRYFMTLLLVMVVSVGWADTVTDVLNQTLIGVTGTSYTEWSGKTGTSGAVYAGQSAGSNSSIQLRSDKSNSGIVSTGSGGKLKKIAVTWNSNTVSGRTLNVYGKNTAYSAATDLYDESNQGTLLGTIVCGTSTELTVTGDYEYVGLRSASGAMYLTEVDITWEESSTGTPTVAKPTFYPAAGEVESGTQVTIDKPEGASGVMYSFDGETYYNYTSPIEITEKTTIYAKAYDEEGNYSEVVSVAYTIKQDTPEPAYETVELPYEEKLVSSQGKFVIENVSLGGLEAVWKTSSYGMTANGNKCTGDIESWFVSPLIKIDEVASVSMTFDQNVRYFANTEVAKQQATLWVREGAQGTWAQLTIPTLENVNNNNFSSAGTIDLSAYTGKTIQLGFKYLATTTNPGRWELKNLLVQAGEIVQKEEAGLSYGVSTFTATIGEDVEFPVLNNPNELEGITYSSSFEDVATIDENGAITLVGAGQTTIKAAFAGNDSYNAGDASYMLVVKEKEVAGSDKFELVTDATSLTDGDVIILVGTNGDASYALSTTQNPNNRAANDVTIDEDGTITPGSSIQQITLKEGFYFNVGDGYLYAASSSSNWLRTEATADDNAKATISIAENGEATIAFQGSNARNHLRFNPNNGNPIFSCYASTTGNAKVKIYKKQAAAEEASIIISEAGQATFSSTKTYAIPEGLTAYVVTAYSQTDNNVTLTPLTSVIPANTGVVVKGNKGSYPLTESSESESISTNYLKANVTAYNLPAEEVIGTDTYYNYTLAADGFKHSSGNGILAAGKAYLQIPYNVTTNAKLSLVFDGEGTGINNVNANDNANNKIFNLSGQRVGASFKGLVIKNGKKYINK